MLDEKQKPNYETTNANAKIAQLVEHNVANVGVASSILVFRLHAEKVYTE